MNEKKKVGRPPEAVPKDKAASLSKSVFIYGLVDPRTKLVRYIGKAYRPKSRFRQHMKPRSDQRMTKVKSWVLSLASDGLTPELVILEEATEANWRDCERAAIQRFRETHQDLLNIADGGNEPPCDERTRADNAAKLKDFTERNSGLMALVRYLSDAARRRKAAGDSEKSCWMYSLVEYIKTSDGSQRERFNSLGMERLMS